MIPAGCKGKRGKAKLTAMGQGGKDRRSRATSRSVTEGDLSDRAKRLENFGVGVSHGGIFASKGGITRGEGARRPGVPEQVPRLLEEGLRAIRRDRRFFLQGLIHHHHQLGKLPQPGEALVLGQQLEEMQRRADVVSLPLKGRALGIHELFVKAEKLIAEGAKRMVIHVR